MATLSLRAGYAAQAGRELAHAFAAAATVVETAFKVLVEILAEAEQHSSAARSLFPLAD